MLNASDVFPLRIYNKTLEVMGGRCMWILNWYDSVVSFFIVYQKEIRMEEKKNRCQRRSVCDTVCEAMRKH